MANAKGPKVTILVGNSYGAGNYAMASRALKPAFVMSWPSARQALMGGPQAAKVMEIVTEAKWARKGIEPDEKMRQKLQGQGQMIQMGLELLQPDVGQGYIVFPEAMVHQYDRVIRSQCRGSDQNDQQRSPAMTKEHRRWHVRNPSLLYMQGRRQR